MSELIEKGARAVYEADPILRAPSWTETVHWNDLLENTRQTSREQFKAALAVVAEWHDTNTAAHTGMSPGGAICKALEEHDAR